MGGYSWQPEHCPLIPAQAGIQGSGRRGSWPWVPAFAGTSGEEERFNLPLRISCASPIGAADDGHQLLDLAALIRLVAGSNRVFDAMADVIAQYLLLQPPQGGADRRDLRHDIDAVAVLVHHAG